MASGSTPFLLACLVAILFNGPVMHAFAANAADVRTEVEAVRAGLPRGARLVSLRRIHHKFLYWYGEPIPIVPWPDSRADVPEDLEFFVFMTKRGRAVELPFEWETLSVLNMDRTRSMDPEDRVVFGRRIPAEGG